MKYKIRGGEGVSQNAGLFDYRQAKPRLVFTGLIEAYVRPALLGECKVYFAGCDVHQAVAVIQREIIVRLLLKFLQ